jgi:hypothetical protein
MSHQHRTIYFDELQHKYTDDRGNIYTSVTTVISKYYEEFDTDGVANACERIGKNPLHPKYLKYKGKSAEQIKAEWIKIKDVSLVNGNEKHDYLEDITKRATGYRTIAGTDLIQDRLFTYEDIVNNTFGALDFDWFTLVGINKKYPAIYSAIVSLHQLGFKFYAELGVYNIDLLISGKIDLVAIRDNEFIIIDWKTNKDDIKYEAGYFEKDIEGNTTDNFIYTHKYMKFPIHMLADSTGVHYNLQVSGYAWLLEQIGLKNLGNLIYQIREKDDNIKIDIIELFDYKHFSATMFKHHFESRTLKQQLKIFV